MLIIEPVSNKKIWGTPRLHKYGGDTNIDLIGSVYSASAIEEIQTRISLDTNNQFTGMTFYDAVNQSPEIFGLDANVKEYPLIIAMTAADEDLSIQVHPTDAFAQKYEHKLTGKSESWYFIEAPEAGSIYAESKLDDKDLIAELIQKGKVDDVVARCNVKKGQLVYIPCGTLHALTKGSLVYEIQQSTDITYRFYDYNRLDQEGNKRELHLDKAIQTLNTKNRVDVVDFNVNDSSIEREYRLDFISLEKEEYVNVYNIAQVFTVIEGKLKIQGKDITIGKSMIVLPFESVKIEEGACKAIVATPIKYY